MNMKTKTLNLLRLAIILMMISTYAAAYDIHETKVRTWRLPAGLDVTAIYEFGKGQIGSCEILNRYVKNVLMSGEYNGEPNFALTGRTILTSEFLQELGGDYDCVREIIKAGNIQVKNEYQL